MNNINKFNQPIHTSRSINYDNNIKFNNNGHQITINNRPIINKTPNNRIVYTVKEHPYFTYGYNSHAK